MKRGFMYCVGIFSVPMMGVLGIHKSTKMKLSFVTQEKKCWAHSFIVRQTVASAAKFYVYNRSAGNKF
jgi:hypothetical protein